MVPDRRAMKKRKSSRGSSTSYRDDASQSSVLESHGYVLGKIVGKGSYAVVRVAQSRKGETVAIKIVSKFQAPDEYLHKFLPREIDAVKGLKHPNLIRFIQAIESTHRMYIIMEYAEKGTLLEAIRKDIYIDEDRSRRWFRQLVDVVEYCHQNGVVHRDIKCDNLLVSGDDTLKLSDFGFARANMGPPRPAGTCPLSETFCGSFAYAAPEVLKGVPYYPHAADIWSMGVVLFAMVFGKLPFDDTNTNLLLKQVQHRVVFPRMPEVSKACKALINKILCPSRQRADIQAIRADSWFNGQHQHKPTSAVASVKVSVKKPTTDNEPAGSTSNKAGAASEPTKST